jgi:hypothetical protein
MNHNTIRRHAFVARSRKYPSKPAPFDNYQNHETETEGECDN